MIKSLYRALPVTLVMLTGTHLPGAAADELTDASMALCEKVRSCVMAEMGGQISPQIQAMLEPTLDQMCETMKNQVTQVPADHEMYQPALECLQSLEKISCATMTSGEDFITEPCRKYEDRGKQALGIE
ncbi:hypothetical protein EYC98_03145 [Halieaceae bacterium IMCC14734]|uniref:Secreted protein n=1 Tax=Candidatus Litorirhabdus singularis TaxID=2518993 RepID=A0ABT3TC46_9GAMM|nr:hypothetical protein [Candidatus Litorirhabdus singularis]MCX2979855.1 hypothetical protein [Candidatus Litorirhabdus singularis]